MKKFQNVIRKFCEFMRGNDVSFLMILSQGPDAAISLGGERGHICASLHSALDGYKRGEGNEGQNAVADTILDVLALTYSPAEISAEMSKRVDTLLGGN